MEPQSLEVIFPSFLLPVSADNSGHQVQITAEHRGFALAIFLHFLNREAYRAADTEYKFGDAMRWLRILSIARKDALFTNFSNLVEGGYLNCNGPILIRELLAQGKLFIAGEKPSLTEFVESRISRYGFDSARYPMYFGSKQTFIDVCPHLISTSSNTEHLQQEIVAVAQHNKSVGDLRIHPRDYDHVRKTIGRLSEIVQQRGASGITRSLFAGRLDNPQQETSASRLISTSYIDKYLRELGCDIATGIPQLGVFDHLSSDPFGSNIQLLNRVLYLVGFRGQANVEISENDYVLAALRGNEDHLRFANAITILCAVIRRVAERSNASSYVVVEDVLSQQDLLQTELPIDKSIYAEAEVRLFRIVNTLRRSIDFCLAYEEIMAQNDKLKMVLLVTATNSESHALWEVAKGMTRAERVHIPKQNYCATEIGQINQVRLIHVQCEPGSVGASSSQAVITEAIDDFSPDAIVLAGIAFGIDPAKQKIGDILVAKSIVEYEKTKVKENSELPRGQRIESSSKLISLFRIAEVDGCSNGITVTTGLMLSGEKLVDSEIFLNKLLAAEPEAIGGEMEGAGLVAAAKRKRTDWIVIKGIVDWGRNKSSTNSPTHQVDVARGVFNFIFNAFARIGF